MSFQDDNRGRRRRKGEPEFDADSAAPSRQRRRNADGQVGQALRSAYDRVVEEDIPPEMLDLLGKLG